MPKLTVLRVIGAATAALLLLLPTFIDRIFWIDLGATVFIWAAVATAWNISAGFGGGLSLGHAAFFGIGAYTSSLLFLQLGISPWIGMVLGGVLAAAVGAVLGVLTLRLRGPYYVLGTLAFGIVVHIIAVNWRSVTRGAAGLVLPFRGGAANMLFADLEPYWYIGLGLLAFTIGISAAIERSRLGYYLVALREDEEAARSLGVRVVRCKVTAVAISAGLSAVAGSVYASFLQYIDPDSITQFQHSIQIALVAIVGGLGTTLGPTLGAFIVVPLAELLRVSFGGGPSMMVYGLLLVVIVLAAPNGAIAGLQAIARILQGRKGNGFHA